MTNLAIIFILLMGVNHGGSKFEVQALASQKRPTKSNSRKSSGTGFAPHKSPPKKKPKTSVDSKQDNTLSSSHFNTATQTAVDRVFSVCVEIQKAQIYRPPRWADLCKLEQWQQTDTAVIATKNVSKGQIITLFPIHALGLTHTQDGREVQEFITYNQMEDGELFNKQNLRLTKLGVPLDIKEPLYPVVGNESNNKLFVSYLTGKEITPGWLGGTIKTAQDDESNCVVVPLPGAAPFCAVVASRDIEEGSALMRHPSSDSSVIEDLKGKLAKDYRRNISMLRLQIETACEVALAQAPASSRENANILGPFHSINLQYPGIKQIHKNPDIYEVANFLTADQCDRIISKAKPHLFSCYVGDADGVSVKDPWRTNTVANLPRSEAPSIVQKITDLACCHVEQLETLQVLNYKEGQQFKQHTDGMSGPITASGFEQSTRLATVFCYLNEVPEGGSTYFPKIDINIRPRKGTAIIHFPVDLNMKEDIWTVHQGMPAKDEKWLLATWVWKTKRVDEAFSESKLANLSSDII